jgi:hypothetical protein
MKICAIVNQKNYIERFFDCALLRPEMTKKGEGRFGVVHSHSIVLGGLVEMS